MPDNASVTIEIQKHNTLCLAKGALLILVSLFCWWLSYWIIKGLFFIALSRFSVSSAGTIATWIGLGGCLLLVIEGFRVGRPSMQVSDIAAWRKTNNYGGYEMSRMMGQVYMISEILFYAPRSMVKGISSLMSRLKPGDNELKQAEKLMSFLVETNTWHEIEKLEYDDRIMNILYALKLVRFREAGTKTEINLSPRARDLFNV